MIGKIILVLYLGAVVIFMIWAIREQCRRVRQWRRWDLEQYLRDIYKIPCKYCEGTGYEGYTLDGEPTGEICEHCDSYGYLWRATFPPRWLKHGNVWRQTEIEELQALIV